MTTRATDYNNASKPDFRAAGRDLGGLGYGPTSRPVSMSGGAFSVKFNGYGFSWAADIPTVLRQAADRVGALASEAATMACDIDAQDGDLKSAEEAICNFAEQRNEAMREVDRLLVENAGPDRLLNRALSQLEIAQADIERGSEWADYWRESFETVRSLIQPMRASRDEACGLLREARARIVELEKGAANSRAWGSYDDDTIKACVAELMRILPLVGLDVLRHQPGAAGKIADVFRAAIVEVVLRAAGMVTLGELRVTDPFPRTYSDEQREAAITAMMAVPNGASETLRQRFGRILGARIVDAVAQALGMRRAEP